VTLQNSPVDTRRFWRWW